MNIDQTLGDLVAAFPKSKRNLYPIIDGNGNFIGIINLDDIRNILFRSEFYNSIKIKDLVQPCESIPINTRMEKVMNLFESTGKWNLPITDEKKYIGFLSRSRIFAAYRSKLQGFYE
jgi:CIC family chloride channel protein